jgi:hypothetical protein
MCYCDALVLLAEKVVHSILQTLVVVGLVHGTVRWSLSPCWNTNIEQKNNFRVFFLGLGCISNSLGSSHVAEVWQCCSSRGLELSGWESNPCVCFVHWLLCQNGVRFLFVSQGVQELGVAQVCFNAMLDCNKVLLSFL